MPQLQNVSMRFGERLALDDLSVAVPRGQVVGLLGPNGSGKTTAMRIVFGVIDADAGVVRYRDRPLDADARRRFGYMPQERGPYPRMKVHDHLVYLARLTGIGAADAARRSPRLVEELGVADRAEDRIPFSSLDPVAVDALSATLARRAAEGGAVLFSSHRLDLVESVCESVAVISAGRLILSGRLRDPKRGAGRRRLRLEVEGDDHGDGRWARSPPGVRAAEHRGPEALLLLEPDVEPLEVLDAGR